MFTPKINIVFDTEENTYVPCDMDMFLSSIFGLPLDADFDEFDDSPEYQNYDCYKELSFDAAALLCGHGVVKKANTIELSPMCGFTAGPVFNFKACIDMLLDRVQINIDELKKLALELGITHIEVVSTPEQLVSEAINSLDITVPDPEAILAYKISHAEIGNGAEKKDKNAYIEDFDERCDDNY